MPKPTKGARLGGSASHQKAILANLATALFEHGRIHTTEAKAKRVRPYAEKLITKAKGGTLADRREVLKVIRNKDVVHALFADIGPSFAEREGGYTRIIKTVPRKGDNADMAIIELVRGETVSAQASRATRVAASRRSEDRSEARTGATTQSGSDTASKKAAAPAKENVVKAAEDDASAAAADNADAVADAVEEQNATAADAAEAKKASDES